MAPSPVSELSAGRLPPESNFPAGLSRPLIVRLGGPVVQVGYTGPVRRQIWHSPPFRIIILASGIDWTVSVLPPFRMCRPSADVSGHPVSACKPLRLRGGNVSVVQAPEVAM